MADRYWVGGSGTWNTTSTTNWSATSGGSGGASVPTAADNVFFDASAVYTVTMTGALACNDFSVYNGDVTFATGTTPTLTVAGNFLLRVTTLWTMTGTVTFTATSAKTINGNAFNFNGGIMNSPFTFNGVGGSWTFVDDLTFAASRQITLTNGTVDFNNRSITLPGGITVVTGSSTLNNTGGTTASISGPITHTSGTLNLGTNLTTTSATGYTLTAGTLALNTFTLTTPIFSSSNANTRTINFGTGKIVLNSATTSTVWNTGTITGLTISGTPLVECIGGGAAVTKTISAGALTEANAISFSLLETTGTATYAFTAGNTIKNLIVNGSQTISNIAITIYGTFTHLTTNGTTLFTGGTNAWTYAATSGTQNITTQSGSGINNVGSVIFNGGASADLLSFPASSTAYNLSGTSWTVECWIYPTLSTFSDGQCRFLMGGTNGVNTAWNIALNSNYSLSFSVPLTGSTGISTAANAIKPNQWQHVAVVNNAGTFTIYIDGVQSATPITTVTKPVSASIGFKIGYDAVATVSTQFSGFISEVRINTTTPVYTGAFTPPTLAALATSGSGSSSAYSSTTNVNTSFAASTTTLLTCQSTTSFVDNSSGALAVTRSGSPVVSIASPSVYSYNFPWTFGSTASTATWTLVNNTTLSRQVTLVCGTLDFNNKTLSSLGFTINNTVGTSTISNTGGSGTLTISMPITHTSGTLTLPFNLTETNSLGYTFTAGTLALSTFTLTTTIFSSNNANTRTLNFGTGKIVLNGSATNTIWNTGTITGLTVSGTPLVESIGGGTGVTKTINTGTLSEANAISFSLLETTGTATYAFTAGNTVKNLTINGVQTLSNIAIVIYGNFTHSTANGTTTFTAGANAWTFGATSGTYSIGHLDAVTYDFPWTFGSAASTATWSLPNNLTLGATRQLTLTNGTFDMNNKTISAAGFTIATGTPTLANTGGSSPFTTSLPFTHTSGSFTLPFDITITSATGYTFTAGTLALSTFTLTTRIFSSANANTRTLNFGTGKIVLNGSVTATIWNTSTITGLTVSGTPLVECIGGGTAVTKTISPGALSEANSISFSLLETTGTVTYTITTATSNVRNLIVNGVQTLTNSNIGIFGTFTHLTTNGTTTFSAGTNAWIFAATSGSYTINHIAGFTYDFPWTFGSAASTATWSLSNNLTLGATRQLTLTNGILDVNNKTVSASGITVVTGSATLNNTGGTTLSITGPITHTSGTLTLGTNLTTSSATGYTLTAGTLNLNNLTMTTTIFVCNSGSTRSISFGTTGQITLTGNNATILSMAVLGGFTYTGTPRIYSSYSGATGTRTFLLGSTSGAVPTNVFDITFTTGNTGLIINPGTDTVSLQGVYYNADFTNLTNTISNDVRSFYGNFTVPATGGTFTAGANVTNITAGITVNINVQRTLDFPITINSSGGTFNLLNNFTIGSTRTLTLTTGTIAFNTYTLTTGLFSSSGTSARTLAFGTSGQLALSGSGATIFDTTTATSFTTTGTVYINCTYTGSVGTRTIVTGFTEAQSVGYDVATSGTTGIVLSPSATDTVALTGSFEDINLTGFTGTLSNTARTIYGNWTNPSTGGTYTAGTLVTTFASSTSKTLSGNGRTLDFPVTFNNTAGSWAVQTNFVIGSTRTTTLTAGTLNLNNLTFTTGLFNSSGFTARTLAFGSSGQLALSGNGVTIFDVTTTNAFTTSGTPYINCTYTGATGTRTIVNTFTETQAIGYNVATSGTTGIILSPSATDTVALTGGFDDIDLTGFTGTLSNTARTIYGNLTTPASGGTYTAGTAETIFSSSNPQNLTGNGRLLDFPVRFSTPGSIYFNGSQNLSIASNPILDIWGTTGSMTIEFWFYNIGTGQNGHMVVQGVGNTNRIWIVINSDQTVALGTAIGGSFQGRITSPATTANAWHHVAITRVGTLTTMYIDGNSVGTTTAGFYNGGTLYLGTQPFTPLGTDWYNGYISNFRIVNGVAVYTGNFTPPTSPLTATQSSGTNISAITGSQTSILLNSSSALTFISDSSTYGLGVGGSGSFVYPSPFTFSSSWTLQNAFTVGSTRTTTLSSGTLNLNSYTFTTGLFNSSGNANRTLAYGTGQLALSGSSATIFDTTTSTNLTTTGTPYINCTYASSVGTRTIVTGFTEAQASAGYSVATSGTSGIVLSPSATDTVALTGSFYNINLTGFIGTLSNTARTIYGSWTNPSTGGTYTAGTLATTFGATTSQNITGNGRTLDWPVIFNGVGGSWTLQTAYATGTAKSTTLTAGTLNLNNYNYTTQLFSSSGAVARTLAFGTSGQLVLVGGNAVTIFDTTTATNYSTTGNIYINCTYALATGTRTIVTGFTEAQAVGYDVSTSGTSGIVLTSAIDTIALTGSFEDINLTGFTGTLSNTARTIYGNWTNPATGGTYTAGTNTTTFRSTSSKTISSNNRTLDWPITFDGVGGTWTLQTAYTIGATRVLTWNNGTLDLNNQTLSTPASITINGGATGLFTVKNTGGTQVYTTTAAVTHTTGELNLFLNMSFGAYTFTAGTITLNSYTLTCTTFTSTSTTARTFAFGTGNITVTGSSACFTMTGATNHVVTGTPNVNITNSTTTATTVAPGAVTEAQSLNFYFSGGAYALTFLATASHVARDVVFASGWAGTWAATSTGIIYGKLTLVSTMTLTTSASAMTFAGTSGTEIITSATKTIPFPLTFNGVGTTWVLQDTFNCSAAVTFTNGTIDGNSQSITATSFTMVTGSVIIQNFATASSFTHTSGTLTLNSACSFGAYTFTATTLNLSGYTLTCTSWTSTSTTARTLAFGTGNITVTGSGACFNMLAATNITVSGTPNVNITNSTTTATSVVPGALTEAQSMNFIFSGGAYTLTFLATASHVARDVTFNGSWAGTWAATSTATIYGSLTLGSAMTLTETLSALTFGGAVANTSKTITTAGKAIPIPLTFNSSVSGWILQDALTMGVGVAKALIITAGIFDVNQKAITAGFAGSTMSTNGTVTLRNLWNNTTIPFTLTSGALTITSTITNPNDVTHWFNGTVSTGTAYISYLNAAFTFTAGTLTLGSDFWITSGSLFTYTAGTIALSNFELQVGRLAATGATTRVIQFGTTGKITTLGTGTVWDQTTIGTFSYTGTSKINIVNYTTTAITVIPGVAIVSNAQNFTFWGNASNPYTLTFLATATHTAGDVIFDSNWTGTWAATAACTIFGNLQIASGVTLTSSASAMTLGATSSKTIISSGKTIPFPLTFSGVGGTWTLQDALTVDPTLTTTLNNGTLNLNDYQLTTGLFSSTSSTARTIAFGTTPLAGRIVINYAGATATVFTTATVTNLTVTGAYPVVQVNSTVNSLASTYTVATGIMTEANAMNFWFQGNFTLSFLAAASYSAKDIDFGYYGSFNGTWATTTACTVYGSVILGPSMTLTTSASVMTFGATSGTKTFKSNGKSIPFPVTLNAPGSTWQITDAFTLATVTTAFTHTNGTLDLNTYTCTVGTYATGAGTKTLQFNGGNFYVTGSGATAFNNANPTNYTVSPTGGYGYLFMSSATAKTFVGGGSNFDCYGPINSGAGALTISGASTYTYIGLGYTVLITGSNSFKNIVTYGPSRVLTLTAGTTQTITVNGGWQVSGSAGDLTTINSATAGSLALIARNYAVNDTNYGGHMDYVSLNDINFTPSTTNGSGALPNIWWAGSHSTNLGNNFGVTFTDWSGNATTSIKTYYISLTSVTSWTIPADWNSSNNIIHLIGGGGGGAGSRTVGGNGGGCGGGGGGYTRITNYSASAGAIISTTIGAAGAAGGSNAVGSAGGTTVFGAYSAGGGGGGGYSTAGTAGVGSTYNGGRGGLVLANAPNNATGGGSGGGGGAGGPFGNGAQGGDRNDSTGSATGGGGNGGGYPGSQSGGGNGWLNTGGGSAGVTNGVNGTAGALGTGGGAGPQGAFRTGLAGGSGFDILGFIGSGGGGGGNYGGSGGGPGGTGGLYGAGGAGAGINGGANPYLYAGGPGAQGVIVIQYYPLILSPGTPGVGSGFFAFF